MGSEEWTGWGDDLPYHHPVFALTHHSRPPVAMQHRDRVAFRRRYECVELVCSDTVAHARLSRKTT